MRGKAAREQVGSNKWYIETLQAGQAANKAGEYAQARSSSSRLTTSRAAPNPRSQRPTCDSSSLRCPRPTAPRNRPPRATAFHIHSAPLPHTQWPSLNDAHYLQLIDGPPLCSSVMAHSSKLRIGRSRVRAPTFSLSLCVCVCVCVCVCIWLQVPEAIAEYQELLDRNAAEPGFLSETAQSVVERKLAGAKQLLSLMNRNGGRKERRLASQAALGAGGVAAVVA